MYENLFKLGWNERWEILALLVFRALELERSTVWCMARCVQIRDYFSVEPQARFLNFTIYLFQLEIVKLKNLATFQKRFNLGLIN